MFWCRSVVEAVKARWQDIIHPALMEYPVFWGFCVEVANKCISHIHACVHKHSAQTCLSEELQFAERFPASLSPWGIRLEAFFPPSTSLEWQTAFQAVQETSASPKISGDEEGKRKLTDITRGASRTENREILTVVCSERIASSAIHLAGFLRQVCFYIFCQACSAIHPSLSLGEEISLSTLVIVRWMSYKVRRGRGVCYAVVVFHSFQYLVGGPEPLPVHSPVLLMEDSMSSLERRGNRWLM